MDSRLKLIVFLYIVTFVTDCRKKKCLRKSFRFGRKLTQEWNMVTGPEEYSVLDKVIRQRTSYILTLYGVYTVV